VVLARPCEGRRYASSPTPIRYLALAGTSEQDVAAMDFDPETATPSPEIPLAEPLAEAGQGIEESRETPPERVWRARGEPLPSAACDSEERAEPEWKRAAAVEPRAQPPQSPAAPALEFYPEPGWREILFTLFSANCRPLLQAAARFALGVVTALLGVRLAHRISPLPSGLKPSGHKFRKIARCPSRGPGLPPAQSRSDAPSQRHWLQAWARG
jgi:hypothetical protein